MSFFKKHSATDNQSARQQFTKAAFPRLCLLVILRLSFRRMSALGQKRTY